MALIIMTGMHYALVPVIISNLATLGFDKFLPLTYISNMGQAGATLGVFFRAKDKKLKSVALSTSFTALMGVTEPAMYGVNMKYKKPFIAAMIGSAAGGGFALAFGAKAYALAGNGGIPGLPGLVGQTFWYAFGGMVIAFVVGAVVTVLLGFQEEADDAAQISGNIAAKPANEAPQSAAPAAVEIEAASATADSTAYAPMSGKAIPLKEVNDPTFGDELMGKGIAFVPAVGELVSPVSGTVMNVFKTKHAMVIRDESGMELLIHVGINTVKLRGQFFEAHVQTGDQVQAGDKLLTFDLEQIAQNYDITTAMVVTNTADYKQILPIKLGPVGFGEPVLRAEL